MNIEFNIIKVRSPGHDSFARATTVFKLLLPEKFSIGNSSYYEFFLNTLITGGVLKLYIDMCDVNYIDSWGIGILISATKRIRGNKGELVLSNTSSEIKKIFSLVKLESFLKIFDSEPEAINYFR
jgi:anti-sigma B factor antagonist